ncbi:MAG: S8 family serine peptidase [Candidatus Delongbacteria bacterium]|nr:S8 family serine peptidase [Candidatus Delongbacteria bacterium]
MRKLVLILLGTITLTTSLLAGRLSPGLELFLDNMADSELITVMLAMSDQADIATLSEELHREQAPLAQRHEQVVSLLQQTAFSTQSELLLELAELQETDLVEGWTSHWLSNMVIVRATVATVRQLALRSDVEQAELDLKITMIEPVEIDHDNPPPSRSVVDGVDNIEADRVWYELGVFGEGAIIAGIDTGVMGSHVSFSTRWQGNFAPNSEGWLDVLGSSSTPNDGHGHGTHTMGTMCGASSDTIGVAPGARWIATNPIDQGTGGGFDNDVIAALEWVCDPDGDPGTVDDMADVAQNSWGVNEYFSGYYDCDSRWWDAIDNCEAAGTVLTWSAGNEGPGSTSLRSPADRADSPYNCFSVGSTLRYPPFTISSFSSRGPSGCGGPYATKPEVCAPGSDIYSAYNNGGYTSMSGTSMAGPHVAGVVGLMRSANPDVDVETIKQILMDTAIDLGANGEDNTYGWGFIDAYEAVLAVMDGYGTVQGVITDEESNLPITGVLVRNSDGQQATESNDAGEYQLYLAAGVYNLEYSAFGYFTENLEVNLPEDDTVVVDVTLAPAATATLSGHVYDPLGTPMTGATVSVLDTPLDPAYTDGTGYYSLEIPIGATYAIIAWSEGWGADQNIVYFLEDMTVDFTLVDLVLEDFETGDFSSFLWEMGGNTNWIMDNVPHEGEWCAESGNINDNQSSYLEITLEVVAAGEISFWYKVSSEANYDYLHFSVDGGEQGSWSGNVAWTEFSTTVTSGEHTFRWTYDKDYSVSNGSDCGWVDYIIFPPIGPPPMPDITVMPEAFTPILDPGELLVEPLSIINGGTGELTYAVTVARSGLQTSVPYLELRKGEADPRPGQDERDQGGPDAFGHYWIDSDEVGGPVYNWVEINDIGGSLPPVDDGSWGPFPLGFEFDFYGTVYDGVYLSTNGLLLFTSINSTHNNQGMPHSSEPNCLIAPFWDDLDPSSGGTVYTYADLANQRFIAEWDGVNHYISGNPETFQVILNSDGTILYQYQDVALGTSCSVGIENQNGTDGLQIAFNNNYLHDEMAILIHQNFIESWLTVTPVEGTVPPFNDAQLEVTFDAGELPEGSYNGLITISSNDPDEATVLIPVDLVVGWLEAIVDLTIFVSDGNLLLQWSPVVNATHYTLWQCSEPWGTYTQIGTTTGYSWSQPLAGEQQFFRVIAVN